ncbi:MAG: thioredoxin family protein [Armatimonadetes bacterium]|nr:thioredoxin family protein [Armatimonadota bacterium]
MRKTVLIGTALALVALLVAGCPAPKPPDTSIETSSEKAPEATASDQSAGEDSGKASSSGVPVIGRGEEVTLEEHLVSGKTTVFDFYSEQCSACMMLAPELEKLAAKRSDLAIIKIDVNRPDVTDTIDWDSPLARQHKLESLPHLVIFDADGKQIASGEEAYSRVTQWISE